MITCPCNVDLLTPHLYIMKLRFTEVYSIFFVFLHQSIYCGYSSERVPTVYVLTEKENMTLFHLKIIVFTAVNKFHNIMHVRVFIKVRHQ